MAASLTIPKHPALDASEDYAWLRAKGLEHIQRLGSRLWTDYNVHDPGITILELLCYAITDLGYRSSLPMADLLAPPGKLLNSQRQGFFTAREILTMSPLTVRDFRKLLIDRPGVRNAWLQLPTAVDIPLYVDCAKSQLRYFPETDSQVEIKGLYDVLVELEDDAGAGNINAGKVFHTFSFDQGRSTALIELRLPSWQQLEAGAAQFADLRAPGSGLITSTAANKAVTVQFISGNKGDDQDIPQAAQASALRRVVYVTMQVKFLKDRADASSTATLTLTDVPMRVWFKSDAARKVLALDDLKALKAAIEDPTAGGLLGKYFDLIHRADAVIADVREELQAHRNLCEDWRRVHAVAVEDIAVCADFELDPSADIEAVTAEAYYRIDRYMSPEIRFRTLNELLDRKVPVEQIFEGPRLENGFLDDAEVDATNLRQVVYVSDLYNELMDIPGVLSIRNVSLARYDQEGTQAGPASRWEMAVTPGHQPRFYPQASKFLFFKNGLPFLPDASELHDLLQVFKARNGSPKSQAAENDLPVPAGQWLPLQDYQPIQYQLPATYGVGFAGLPANAGVQRIAQARQLKAYLLFFEQRLVDYLAQLANVSECFAIDETVKRTYFSRFLRNADIRDLEQEIYLGLDASRLAALSESSAEYLDRRNRFLDHLLARFAESFADYALILFRTEKDKAVAREKLIDRKIAFLRALPTMTHDRAKAFDYTQAASPCGGSADNAAGLAARIRGLLGLEESERVFLVEHLLLRPRQPDADPLLPICTDAGCEACGGQDPYSFRLSVILARTALPSEGEMEWRRYAETVVRAELPAHLAARICWVAPDRLAAFETAWCAWLQELKSQADPDGQSLRLKDLLKELAQLKNVYPPASLHDCLDGNDENRVFLDRSVITSIPEE